MKRNVTGFLVVDNPRFLFPGDAFQFRKGTWCQCDPQIRAGGIVSGWMPTWAGPILRIGTIEDGYFRVQRPWNSQGLHEQIVAEFLRGNQGVAIVIGGSHYHAGDIAVLHASMGDIAFTFALPKVEFEDGWLEKHV